MHSNSRIGLPIFVALIWSLTAFSQANFLFRNLEAVGEVNAPVFDADGVPLAGADYRAELWGGPVPDSLAPLVLLDLGNQRLIKSFLSGGYVDPIDGGLLVVPNVPPSGWAWLEMRAWDARLGATYEEASSLGLGGYGESPLFYAQGGTPFSQFPIPGTLIGLQSFSLRPVIPEPSVWALLGVGGLIFGWAFCGQRK